MKKLISIILAVSLLIFLVSCGGENNRSYDEAIVKAEAEKLIIRASKLNDVFWGDGIAYDEEGEANGVYYPADKKYLSALGASTVAEIVVMASEVFSEGYIASIYSSVFSSQSGDFAMAGYARYYQGKDTIMVYSKYNPLLTDFVEYITSDIEVLYSKGEIVTVKVPIKVTRDGAVQSREIKVNLIEEKDGWRIDSPTYAVFDASKPAD